MLVASGLVVGAPRVAARVALAAPAEAVGGAALEVAGAGRADGVVAGLDSISAGAVAQCASIALAAATETVSAALEEASTRGADGVVASLHGIGVGAVAQGAGVTLAAATESIGT